MSKSKKMLRIKLIKSPISILPLHKKCLTGLGLRKINQVVERIDTPENRGMVNKISYLLKVEEQG